MYWLVDLIWLAVSAIAYWAYGPTVSVAGAAPVLPVILLVRVALNEGDVPGNLFGFTTGALLDVFSLEWLGSAMLVDSIIGYVIGAIRTHIVLDSPLVRVGLLLGASLAHSLGLVLVRSVAYAPGPEPFVTALLAGLYTTVVGAVWWGVSGAARSFFGMASIWRAEQ